MLWAMWWETISAWTDKASFHEGASTAAIRACEATLGQTLPRDLVELLRESNGVDGEYGLGLVWPVERIQADNVRFRTDAHSPACTCRSTPCCSSPTRATATSRLRHA